MKRALSLLVVMILVFVGAPTAKAGHSDYLTLWQSFAMTDNVVYGQTYTFAWDGPDPNPPDQPYNSCKFEFYSGIYGDLYGSIRFRWGPSPYDGCWATDGYSSLIDFQASVSTYVGCEFFGNDNVSIVAYLNDSAGNGAGSPNIDVWIGATKNWCTNARWAHHGWDGGTRTSPGGPGPHGYGRWHNSVAPPP